MAERLDVEAVNERIGDFEGWEQQGHRLTKRFECEDFAAALAFVNEVGEIAEDLNHHPDVAIQDYDQVLLWITSHEAGGITETDFAFVERVEEARS